MAKPTEIGADSQLSQRNKQRPNEALVSNDNPEKKPASAFKKMKAHAQERREASMSLTDFTERAKEDPSVYMTPAENLIRAIGEPEKIDTSILDQQIRRVYNSETIERYKPFEKFYDAEAIISRLVTYLKGGAEGMLVLNGPVGSGKTQIAETLENLTEIYPVSVLKCKVTGAISPFNDSPLCLLADPSMKDYAIEELGIHENYLRGMVKSPWVTKRLDYQNSVIEHKRNQISTLRNEGKESEALELEEALDDMTPAEEAFEVIQIYPSRERQLGIGKYDPQNKDNPDFSALVGRIDMNRVGDPDPLYRNHPDAKFRGKTLSENDPDAYIPGLLSQSNGGFLHLAEFLRNNPAMMNVFLEGVTTGYFTGAGNIGMLPMRQVICMTSNGPVLDEFRSAKESDAARNRIQEIKVGYTLRMSEELKIYQKFIKEDNLEKLPIAPKTLDLLAEFSIAARLKDGQNSALKPYDIFTRVKVHNGEVPDGVKVPQLSELRAKASPNEGMEGFSVRDAKRTMKLAFEMRSTRGYREADTITLLEALRMRIKEIDVNDISEAEKARLGTLITQLEERNRKEMEKIVNSAIMNADNATCQRIFDEYVEYAKAWMSNSSINTRTGEALDINRILKHLEVFEKRAGISNGPDFRRTTVNYVNHEKGLIADQNFGKEPKDQKSPKISWDSYEPVAKLIRAQFEVDRESRLHILRAKTEADLRSDEERKQFSVFHDNMRQKGYTDTMVSRMLHHLSFT